MRAASLASSVGAMSSAELEYLERGRRRRLGRRRPLGRLLPLGAAALALSASSWLTGRSLSSVLVESFSPLAGLVADARAAFQP